MKIKVIQFWLSTQENSKKTSPSFCSSFCVIYASLISGRSNRRPSLQEIWSERSASNVYHFVRNMFHLNLLPRRSEWVGSTLADWRISSIYFCVYSSQSVCYAYLRLTNNIQGADTSQNVFYIVSCRILYQPFYSSTAVGQNTVVPDFDYQDSLSESKKGETALFSLTLLCCVLVAILASKDIFCQSVYLNS